MGATFTVYLLLEDIHVLALGQFNNLTAAHALANELSLESGLPNP